MSPELVHWAEKRTLQPESCVDVARILRIRDENEQRNMAKKGGVERGHVGGEAPPNWLLSPPHKSRHDTPFGDSPPPIGIPTGPKAHYRAHSRSSSPINIRTLCTPHNRGLSTREVHDIAVLQARVENAIAGTGPSLRILTSIPKSIQLNVHQKQRVYAAQEDLDLAVLGSKIGGSDGSGSIVKKAATIPPSQHDIRSRHDSDGLSILTLPPLHLSESLDGSLIAKSMLMEVNSLLAQLKRERVKISFSAADRETLRIDT